MSRISIIFSYFAKWLIFVILIDCGGHVLTKFGFVLCILLGVWVLICIKIVWLLALVVSSGHMKGWPREV